MPPLTTVPRMATLIPMARMSFLVDSPGLVRGRAKTFWGAIESPNK